MFTGQTDVIESKGGTEDDFLARERAVLGQDAEQFATPQDHVAEGVEGGDDLLGGGEAPAEEVQQFESSFPSMETQAQNEVRLLWAAVPRGYADLMASPLACCSWWYNHRHWVPVPSRQLPDYPRT